MLSISPPITGFGQGDYYLSLATEDYYLKGGEPPGKWIGAGSSEFSLAGEVEGEALRNLMKGYTPDGTKALVQNAKDADRRSGWDLTFSAPKSVSVAWSQSEDEVRAEIQAAHFEAVKRAIDYLNEHAAITRRGKGGVIREPVNLVVASFEHGTSRSQDPQLHTHALVLNVAKRSDGTFGTIETMPLFQNKMAAGALYRAELSAQLEKRLGLRAERVGSWFEIDGVSKKLIGEFSKRRKEIEKALREKGYSSAIAAKVAALNTREKKGHVAREELFTEWRRVGKELGWSVKELERLVTEYRPRRDVQFEIKRIFEEALQKVTEHNSHFTERDLIRYAAESAQDRGIGAKPIVDKALALINTSREIVSLGRYKGEIRYTTREMLELEKAMLERAKHLFDRNSKPLDNRLIESVFKKKPTISDEQKRAVQHIVQGEGAIKIVSGMAGTGKSFMLDATREAFEASGYKVFGAALAGKAAQGLSDDAKINSRTLHKTFLDIENGNLVLDRKSVLVVDEAGMIGTRLMDKVLATAEKSGTQLVLVGDAKQLQPIDAGGPFKEIAARVGEVELKEIRRQDESWARDAIHSFAKGDSSKGLTAYAEKGLLRVEEDRSKAIKALISEWGIKGITSPKEQIILSGSNIDAFQLNEEAQAFRKQAGALGNEVISVSGQDIYRNDRIVLTKNATSYGVKNGHLATVKSINKIRQLIKIELDNGDRTTLPLKEYPHVKLGYAITTHKAQGMTTKDSFVLLGGSMQDREFSYVQVSRARNKTMLFTDKLEAGEKLTDLARQMANSRQKNLSISIKEKPMKFQRRVRTPDRGR